MQKQLFGPTTPPPSKTPLAHADDLTRLAVKKTKKTKQNKKRARGHFVSLPQADAVTRVQMLLHQLRSVSFTDPNLFYLTFFLLTQLLLATVHKE